MLFAFGSNASGQLSTGDLQDIFDPKLIEFPVPIKHLDSGANHLIVVSESGQIYGAGDNTYEVMV